ncbi:RagB/SusD family nutrient uptake outer membrane protein [Niabella sp.]|uniref:RagB/SusD family nutrient uptake outer membrane protein n=1 Tax=Niabella sp. TaxID=1962976 RepID=UPI0026028A7C|nr:RagB/SusD family nutrient uptake outer membrane protein [Niabella sp.]
MKLYKNILFALLLTGGFSCSKFLDVVPDNTMRLENIFQKKEDAWNALAKVYSYMPADDNTHNTSWLLGDEWIGRLDLNDVTGNVHGIRIMRGLQSKSSPQLGYWSGSNGGTPLYQGIRQCDVFLQNIDRVNDMTESDRNDWKAQVKMMKAYYVFQLIRYYGPVVLPTKMATPESSKEELFIPRSKVEDCFKYVLDLMDEAIPQLKERANENDLGQIDKMIALAIKAKVLLFRASPFYNGNREYFGDFVDSDGKPFFPMEYDREKWKQAIDAINAAIVSAEGNGHGLYTYQKQPYLYDSAAFRLNGDKMKTLYDLRMVICDPWNKEVVWGFSNLNYYGQGEIAHATNIRLPVGYGDGVTNSATFSWQWLAATYQMAERYYTKNGLPLDEDRTFDMNLKYEQLTTPGESDPEYNQLRGFMQPGAETINLYMNREPRFYANLGITGGFWRAHTVRINTKMFANSDGGFNSSVNATDYLTTGIGVQKMVHPESMSGAWQRTIKFPYPLIRMADLYLMKAEALNEYTGPSSEVYNEINKIRRRAGIPDVETVWADPSLTRDPGKHLTKEGLRDIILYERSIELAFEGQHYWDMIRQKRAPAAFSAPVWGWTVTGADAKTFFNLEVKQQRKFTITDCLWPIDLNEMNTNGRLIQNPGW